MFERIQEGEFTMNKYWFLVMIAAIFEVIWVAGFKHSTNWIEWSLTIIALLLSFGVLIYAGKKLPTSTVYAVFVGLGTTGTVIAEMIWFHVPFSWGKVGLITLLLIGIIGLKSVTANSEHGHQKRGELS